MRHTQAARPYDVHRMFTCRVGQGGPFRWGGHTPGCIPWGGLRSPEAAWGHTRCTLWVARRADSQTAPL